MRFDKQSKKSSLVDIIFYNPNDLKLKINLFATTLKQKK